MTLRLEDALLELPHRGSTVRQLLHAIVVAGVLGATPYVAAGCGEAAADGGCRDTLPAGSYADSCSSCTMDGTVVSCFCNDGSADVQAELDTCSCAAGDEVWNDHGQLKCTAPDQDSCMNNGRYCGKSNTYVADCCSGYCGDNATCE